MQLSETGERLGASDPDISCRCEGEVERERNRDKDREREEEAENEEVRELAMATLALLKQEVKVMFHQVKQLVKAHPQLACQVFTTDVEGWTPVHACALRGKRKVLKVMLQAGIDVNSRMGQPEGLPADCTLLHIAANRHDKKVVDYLVHHGAHVNARDSFGRTPLFYANRNGNRDVVKLLTDSGARFTPEVEVTSPPEASDPQRTLNEDLMTPEPKLTRFCFLPLPQHHHHQHQHHRHRHRRRQSPHAPGHHNGHRTS